MKRIFVTGANGYIGKALIKQGFLPLSCDVTNYNFVDREISNAKPDLVLHLASKSRPDYCVQHLAESVSVNFEGTRNVARVCASRMIPAVILSSSQVWGGGWRDLFNRHSENSKPTIPANDYGLQKLVAEAVSTAFGAKVIRTSHVFNRVRYFEELLTLARGGTVDAPTFLKRSFIHLNHFVSLLKDYCERFDSMPPVLHLAGSKSVSYCEFWYEVCDQFGFDSKGVKCRRIEKDAYVAKRPHNSGLDVSLSAKLGFTQYDYIQGIGEMKNES